MLVLGERLISSGCGCFKGRRERVGGAVQFQIARWAPSVIISLTPGMLVEKSSCSFIHSLI